MNLNSKKGVLLVNLGTPAAADKLSVRKYLHEFLSDPRVVQIPRVIWWLILHLVVLRIRPKKSAKAYAKIWTDEGSPLLVYMQAIQISLQQRFAEAGDSNIVVSMGMRYGKPSISEGLDNLRKCKDIDEILIIPLYPQYASATTGSTFDAVAQVIKKWRVIPSILFIGNYFSHRNYISALTHQIREFWNHNGDTDCLLFSFHGLPEKSIKDGDPYFHQCHASAKMLADTLELNEDKWQVVFQSRFGAAEWLKPYCVDTLKELPGKGIKSVDVVCPGFSADCLETLEEIAMTNKQFFIDSGGTRFRYIPALNDSPQHIDMLETIIRQHTVLT